MSFTIYYFTQKVKEYFVIYCRGTGFARSGSAAAGTASRISLFYGGEFLFSIKS